MACIPVALMLALRFALFDSKLPLNQGDPGGMGWSVSPVVIRSSWNDSVIKVARLLNHFMERNICGFGQKIACLFLKSL